MKRAGKLGDFFLDPLLSLALVVGLTWPAALSRHLLFGADTITFVLPLGSFTRHWLREGLVPWWNPHIYGGTPHLSGYQSGLYSPFTWLLSLLGDVPATNLSAILYLWLLLWGLLRLGREVGLSSAAAWLSASIAGLGLYQVSHLYAGHLTPLAVMAWTPWSLVLAAALLRRRWPLRAPGLWAVLFAASLALQVWGGHPQYLYYGLVAVFLWLASRPQALLGRWGGRRLLALLTAGALFGLLAAGQLLPTLEHMSLAARAQSKDLSYFGSGALGGLHLLLFLLPTMFGRHVDSQFLLDGHYWEVTGPLTLLGLALAGVGAFAPAARRVRVALLLLCSFGLLVAFGPSIPGFDLAFRFIPGLGLFRALGRALWLFTLAGGLLAGFGLDALCRSERTPRLLMLGSLLALLALFAQAVLGAEEFIYRLSADGTELAVLGREFTLNSGQDGQRILSAYRGLFRWEMTLAMVQCAGLLLLARYRRRTLCAWLGVALVLAVSISAARPFVQMVDPEQLFPGREVLAELPLRPEDRVCAQWDLTSLNLGLVDGFQNISGGNDPLILAHTAAWLNLNENKPHDAMRDSVIFTQFSPLVDELACRYLVVDQRLPVDPERWERVRLGPGNVCYRNRNARPRVELFPSDALARWPGGAPNPMAYGGGGPVSVLWDFTPGEPLPTPSAQPFQPPTRLEFAQPNPNQLDIVCESPAGGLLLLREVWYPGWRAEVSGQQVPVRRINYLFRGVAVPPGSHQVRLRFAPDSHRIGLYLSLLGAALAAGVLGWQGVLGRKPGR